ncbi:hypothetical protein ANANG_G00285450 [Anguilla anguilla]|uniref:Rab11-FIP3/4 domain-containing protein n=1 Tax=Anguilla anguilla TaxID=7936 RepID=A0A9D3RIW7_ANGAN|nr:hypothetical protein ANANG_G00285450 [Anguilla anguilla]
MELENLQTRLQQLDEENCELRSCVSCLHASIERMEEEKRKLQDETENLTDRLNEELRCSGSVRQAVPRATQKPEGEGVHTGADRGLRKQAEPRQPAGRWRRGSGAHQRRVGGVPDPHRRPSWKQEVTPTAPTGQLWPGRSRTTSLTARSSPQHPGGQEPARASFSESLAAEINSVSLDEETAALQPSPSLLELSWVVARGKGFHPSTKNIGYLEYPQGPLSRLIQSQPAWLSDGKAGTEVQGSTV